MCRFTTKKEPTLAKFKLIVSDADGTSQALEVEGPRAQPLIGHRIGEVVDGAIAGLSGKQLKITGGSDRDGFPMRPDVHGGVRRSIVLSGGAGFIAKRTGERRRKRVRGNVITEDIAQINLQVWQ